MSDVGRLVADYVAEARDYDPVAASAVGLVGFDARMGDPGRDRAVGTVAKRRSVAAALKGIDPLPLATDERLDRAFTLALIEADLVRFEQEPWATRPDQAIGQVVQGIHQILMRPVLDGVDRWPSVLPRLAAASDLLQRAARGFDSGASLHACELARRGLVEGGRFFDRLPDIARTERPALADRIASAVARVRGAMADFRSALSTVQAKAEGSFAIGTDRYNVLLRSYHRVPYDDEILLAMGEEMIDHFQGELTACAREIDPNRHWREIVTALKNDHPTADEVIPEYRREITRTRSFVEERRLVSIPMVPDERFDVTETPPFMRSTIPFGFVSMAPVFSASGRGVWHITLPAPDASPEQQRQTLQGHNRWNTRAITFHEGYPGHHLHALHLKRVPGDVRRQFTTSVFVEGWGLYTEDLMFEQGYFTDPRARLIQLVNSLWRAVRVVVDTGLHTRGMTIPEAADMLVQVSRLEPANATIEAARYAITPTYAASYLVGKLLLLDLRKRYGARHPGAADREFHDRLLSFGAIPFDLIERELLATDETVARSYARGASSLTEGTINDRR